MIADLHLDRESLYHEAPYRFEAGTPNIADAVALGSALEYLMSVGLDAVAAHDEALTDYAIHSLSSVPGLRHVGTASHKVGVTSFVVDGVPAASIGAALDRDGVAVRVGHHCAVPALNSLGVEAIVPTLTVDLQHRCRRGRTRDIHRTRRRTRPEEFMNSRMPIVAGAVAAAFVAMAGSAHTAAQGRPKADVSIVADADGVHAGQPARVALRVALPDGVHVQSNAPRDPMLIATAITVTPPLGVSVQEVAYPAASDFAQAGQATPLAVFEQRFAIGIRLTVADDVQPGELAVPVRLRYQACDRTTCFAPLREDITATLRVVARDVKTVARFSELFDALPFRR